MAATEATERWLTHAEVVRLDNRDHHSILRAEELQRRARRWLSMPLQGSNLSIGWVV